MGALLETLIAVLGRRWAIEESLGAAKGEVGLDQYEVRRYDAWHRHVTLALLAHAYLEVTRLRALAAASAGEHAPAAGRADHVGPVQPPGSGGDLLPSGQSWSR